jgi:MFS transporter, PPP family, 3-phenylpropionic acid transporter
MKLSEANRLRLLYFLVLSCTASWLPIFADYLKDHGLTGIEIGVVLSVTPFMMLFIQPFYGMLADRFGYKKCLLYSALSASMSFLLFLVDGDFLFLFWVTLVMSLFYNTLQPLLDSLSLRLAQKNPTFSYGSIRIAGGLGWAFTGTLVGHYIDALDTTVIFVFSAASMLLTFVVTLWIKTDNSSFIQDSPSLKQIKYIFKEKALIILLTCVFLVSAGATTIWNFYSIYMKENGASSTLVGYGLSFQGLCELPLFYFSARIIRKLGIKTTLLVTLLATSCRMLLYSAVKDPVMALFIELLHGISWSLFWVVCVEYVDRLVKEEWRATGQSLLYAAYFGMGAIAGNFWTGYLYDSKMMISEIFLLNSIMIFGLGIVCWIFMKTPEPYAN